MWPFCQANACQLPVGAVPLTITRPKPSIVSAVASVCPGSMPRSVNLPFCHRNACFLLAWLAVKRERIS